MSQLPKLVRSLRNISRSNALVYGDVSTPPSVSAREAYGAPIKILKVQDGAVIDVGDTLWDDHEYYLAGDYIDAPGEHMYRLFRVPMLASVTRMVKTIDAVTQLQRGETRQTVGMAYYSMIPLKDILDTSNDQSRKQWQVVTGFLLQVGDMIAGKQVNVVTSEYGVIRASVT